MANPEKTIQATAFNPLAVTIPPNDYVEKNVTGEFIRCMEADAPFSIALQEQSQQFPFDLGVELRTVGQEVFSTVRFYNDTSETINCEFLYGYGKIEDDRLNVVQRRITSILKAQDAETILEASAVTSLANGASVTFDGVPTGNQLRRKQLIISNQDPGGSLNVVQGGNVGAIVFAGNNYVVESNDEVVISNTSGGAITCKFLEIWYENV